MRIVTIGAGHLAGVKRMSGDLVRIRALFLVASKADFCLGLLGQNLVGGLVNLMAVVASQTAGLVLAAIPTGSVGSLVARQALFRPSLLVGGGVGAFLEDDIRCCPSLYVRVALKVLFAFPVT